MKTGIPTNGSHPIKNGIRIICNTENFVPIVVLGLTSSSSGSSSTLRTSMKQESPFSSSSSSSSPSSPKVGEMSVREREDAPNSDISPVPVSELVDHRTGNLWKPKPTKYLNPIKKKPQQNAEPRVVILRFRNGRKNSWRIWWMTKFHYREALTPVLLMKLLQIRLQRHVRIWVSTVLRLISPKDRNCEICKRTEITIAPCRRRTGEAVPRALNFGDLITADHKVVSENCEFRNNHRYAVVVQDLATQWIQAYPCKNKTSQETQRSLQKFLEPERKPKVIYTDNSLEFGKACEDLSWNHCTWPEGWGPQGRRATGGGGLARVPNLRVYKHPTRRVAHAGREG